ncbi:MAG: GNAT family N-acetyltransferase [Acutalibacteraceae bacterium]
MGKSLLASAAEALRAQGFRKAYLWVLRENDRAIRFYERNGFQFDGVEKTDIRAVPIHEKRYSRAL